MVSLQKTTLKWLTGLSDSCSSEVDTCGKTCIAVKTSAFWGPETHRLSQWNPQSTGKRDPNWGVPNI